MKYRAKCIDNYNGYSNLTIGKIYEVKTVNSTYNICNMYIECVDDTGYVGYFYSSRFRKICENLNDYIKIL